MRDLDALNENDRVLQRNINNKDYGSIKETKEERSKDHC